ncbi:hypothetical protein LUZ63_016708 [Rhynchospora breviuscula]|uniref:Uncharacterized protein n=1 Tax=Rhynchospora breviuscula TaxID=2022672 RepID=A0A9P9ZB44_9POAL|nr:hypothetical protein LUZ63_016708 [Rhynchospora breviuscula]
MASSTVFSFRAPLSIRAQATSNGGSGNRVTNARSANWWAPLFGMSTEPDYIDVSVSSQAAQAADPAVSRRRFGAFTEEKAKELRKKMLETETYHDAMYHSAIASRLASDISRK